jgi:hypothetical protein
MLIPSYVGVLNSASCSHASAHSSLDVKHSPGRHVILTTFGKGDVRLVKGGTGYGPIKVGP